MSDNRKDQIEKKSEEIMKTGVKFYDARHVAAAILAGADYFISVDKRLLKYKTDEIIMINPVDYFMIDDSVEFGDEEA